MTRMRWVKKIPLWFVLPISLGLVGAGLTWWLVERYLEQQIAAQPRLPPLPVEERVVLVPRHDLPAGTQLLDTHLAVRSLESRTLPTDAIEPSSLSLLEARFLAHAVTAGKPLQWLHIVDDSARQLSQQIAPAMRAFTLPMQNDWTHVQQLLVGDRVDFYEQKEGRWQQMNASAEILRLSDQSVTFSIPQHLLARLTESYERQQLRIVLQGVDQQPAPGVLLSEDRPRYFSPQMLNRETL